MIYGQEIAISWASISTRQQRPCSPNAQRLQHDCLERAIGVFEQDAAQGTLDITKNCRSALTIVGGIDTVGVAQEQPDR